MRRILVAAAFLLSVAFMFFHGIVHFILMVLGIPCF